MGQGGPVAIRSRLAAVLLLVAGGPGCSLAPKNFKAIANPAPLVRARAIPLGRGLPSAVVVPSLINRLEDRDQVVRLAAIEELRRRTGQDLGFVPYADPADRAAAVARWREWWKGQPPTLMTRRKRKRLSPSPQSIQALDGPEAAR